ncbi:DUF4238 domain-containing protein [Cereibacter sp. SYSU M97828]|nr:DUF4238 domain-containing protein [Cereibacter flavus]
MTPPNPPQKHHYVPAFYLKGWTDELGKIHEFTQPRSSLIYVRHVKPEATGHLHRLYTLEDTPEELAQVMEEKFFKPLDTMASETLSWMRRHGRRSGWDSSARQVWSHFLLSMLVRAPEDIDIFRPNFREEFGNVTASEEEAYQHVRDKDDPLTYEEYARSRSTGFKERSMFRVYTGLIANESLAKKMSDMHWRVFDLPSHAPTLLSSDRPIIWTPLGSSQGHLALPLSPRQLFVIARTTELIQRIEDVNASQLAKEINRQIVGAAARYVYDVDASRKEFIQKHFGTRPQIRLLAQIAAGGSLFFSS